MHNFKGLVALSGVLKMTVYDRLVIEEKGKKFLVESNFIKICIMKLMMLNECTRNKNKKNCCVDDCNFSCDLEIFFF